MEFPAALGFDVETVGDIQEYALQPCRMLQGKAHISAASFATLEKTSGSLNPTTELMRGMFRRAIDKQMYVVGWNAAFDAAWAIAAGLEDEVMQVKWLDAMLLWRHAVVEPEGDDIPRTHRKSYALAAALKEFAPEHAGFKDFEDFQSEDADDLRLLLHRNQQDALWTVRLAKRFWDMLTDEQQRAALIEARCIPLCAWTKVHGIVGGKQAAKELSKTLQEDAKRIQAELLAAAPEAEGINLGSVKQLQTLLYDTWGLPAERFSKKTNLPSTDKYALFDLAVLDPRAKLIKELREAKNNRTKYAQGTLKSLEYNGDGRVRPQVKIFSTYSSRMTYGSSDSAEIAVEKQGAKKESLWLYHPESEAFLVMAYKDFCREVSKSADAGLCVEVGLAKTGSVAELRRLLKENLGWDKARINLTTQGVGQQSIPRDVKVESKKVKVPVGVALHQWKRGKEYRRLIQAPDGFTLCELDFAGQEFRWMAVASEDETMLALCAPGEDAHSYMGAQIAQCDYKELVRLVHAEDADAQARRKLGKFSNLSFQYRIGVESATTKARVDYEMPLTKTFVGQILATYKAAYTGVPQYWTRQILKCKQLGYAETFAGRRVQLKGNWAGREAWPLESTAINYPIQGTGGDQKYLALAVLRNILPKYGAYFYYELHDGIFTIVPNAVVQPFYIEAKNALSNLPYKKAWGVDLPIKFPVDGKVGPTWGDLKEPDW
ncbi:MAG: hypothetical protein LHW45_10755 [Candidatus Cloacimonetes bacterium]|nr:hypothetical protein [Candidatus Cloacimonadota bacterium]MDY0368088.1 DNA polymerase [Candidatus Syntrophosphaera sp.]